MKKANAIACLGGEVSAAAALRMSVRSVQKMETDEHGNLLSLVLMDRVIAAIYRRRAHELTNAGAISEIEADLARV
jgi:hypothetical protein